VPVASSPTQRQQSIGVEAESVIKQFPPSPLRGRWQPIVTSSDPQRSFDLFAKLPAAEAQVSPRMCASVRLSAADSPRFPAAVEQSVFESPKIFISGIKRSDSRALQSPREDPQSPRDSVAPGKNLIPRAGQSSDARPQENQQPANGHAAVESLAEKIPETPLQKGISAVRAERERQRAKADELRAHERQLKHAAAEQRQAEVERLRSEAEQKRAEAKRIRQDAERRITEQKESLAEEVRQAAEVSRRQKELEEKQMERKRAEKQRAREEAALRRSQGKQQVAEKNQRLAEEARRFSEEYRRRRSTGTMPSKDRDSTPSGGRAAQGAHSPRRRESVRGARTSSPGPSPRRFLAKQRISRRRAASASPSPAAARSEEDQREAERLEKEEAERQRLEQLKAKAEESSNRIASAGADWRRILGVEVTAQAAEVKQAFRELALLHHPDKGLENSNDTFRIVRGAYQRALAELAGDQKATQRTA